MTVSKRTLEAIGNEYRSAYIARDASRAPISKHVRFTENNVEMPFPDASWDTVTAEVGSALTFSDPTTEHVGIFTAVLQNDTPGFLAVRLKVARDEIVEIEHILSTKRNLSGPPTPIGDVSGFEHDPELVGPVPEALRSSREQMIKLADGYFATLENNRGEIRGTRFSPEAVRVENGKRYTEIERGFRLGIYRFNDRVRDRDYFLVDEERGLVMARAFIDHKGVLDEYLLTDGTPRRSMFREPHSWSVLEVFKIRNGMITNVAAAFIATHYYLRSPWTVRTHRLHLQRLPQR
jgi:hypothetical protein